MHTIWKGSISFGLVNIPVKLHAATEDKDVKLRTLHKKCHSPIKYEKICPVCEEKVEKEDIVRAYEYVKGKFVVLDDEVLEQLKKEHQEKAVEIINFVKMDEIDPIYFERSYYLSPDDGGVKAYSLLRKALQESGKAGLAKIVIRSKEQLAIVRVYENTLVLETIHYPDEVRNVRDVPNVPADEHISEKELETAVLLIEQLTTKFDPENYEDEYRNALLRVIEAKRAETIHGPNEEEKKPKMNVTDLMAALQASIDKTKAPSGQEVKKRVPVKVKKRA